MFQIDAFADRLFAGNPAAVCLLDAPLPDEVQLQIARENNLSETAFLLRRDDRWQLRWFTPGGEVKLCGHATLASGHAILTEVDREAAEVSFETISGTLTVTRCAGGYRLDLPAWPGEEVAVEEAWISALGATPRAVRRTERDIYCLLDSEAEVRDLDPDFRALARITIGGGAGDGAGEIIDGVGIGAIGDGGDTVTRFFAPYLGIDEDPVTGSAHSTWVPWIAELTGRTEQRCRQLSKRGGVLEATLRDGRVALVGGAVTFLRGTIELDL